MTNDEFNRMRREAEITSAEIADFAGCTRKEMYLVETHRLPVQNWMVSCLLRLIAQRQTA